MRIKHPIPPLYDENSKILILGSFPSVKSREAMFFYGHRQNRFWKVMAAILGKEIPKDTDEKRKMMLSHGIALWDSIGECDIEGSADASIENVIPNDISVILARSEIKAIFVNGKKSKEIYDKYIMSTTNREAVCLPSTSPANAAKSLDALIEDWKIILEYLG